MFHAARSRDAAAREAYLDHACADDRALRDEVNAMLAAHEDAGGFGDRLPSGSIDDVRQGKFFELELAASGPDEATRLATEVADKLLANPVIESYRIEIL